MRRTALTTLALLALTGCSDPSPVRDPEPAAGPIRTIERAPIPSRVAHTAVWTGEEMVVWGGRGAPDKSTEPNRPPNSHATLPADGAAYDPEADSWRVLAKSPLSGRTGQNDVWTGSSLLIWGGNAKRGKLKDGASYDPAADTWTALPDAPDARSGAQTAWTGTEALFIGGSREDGVAYNPATRAWRALPDAPFHSYDWALSTWTGEEFLLFVETSGSRETKGAAYDPASDTWRTLPTGPVAAGVSSGAVWTGDRAVLFSSSSRLYSRGEKDPLDPGGAYIPKTNKWERITLSPPATTAMTGYGEPMLAGREIVQWGGARPAIAYHLDESRWRSIPVPKIPWREFPSLVWTGTEIIAWGGDSCPPAANCFALMPVEDGVALNPTRA
ncbi:hypothetical protein [Actinocorallia aurantiaca]|uniref:Galactose oxidase n=1 Tax=Actinocorallia aurantiaca TaxID=46204 RepID=A0ABN3UTY7_9ACTN